MLKKAGIVVAAGAASLLALSPLAFAGDSGGHGSGHHGAANVAEKNSAGLVNLANNNVDVSPQVCVGPVASGNNILTGALGLVSKADQVNTQDQSVKCDNASQAGDNVEQSGGKGGSK